MTQNWEETLSKEYPRLSPKSKFRFSCHRGLGCFTKCCRDVNIFLTPYDVLRMKNALKLSSEEFLEKHTIPLLLKEQKLRLVILKMTEDENKTCPFVTAEGCQIYQDRPWACRMYPLGMGSSQTQGGEEDFYFMVEQRSFCQGFEEDKEWTVEEWVTGEGADIYNDKSRSYQEITLHKYIRDGKELGPSKDQMFYLASYDLDRFRRHLFESRFFNLFDVEEAVREKIKTDDEALLEFGARWLRFSLFGENTISIKGEILEGKKKELDRIRGMMT
jgi:Fe-S-cluster containining protein